MYEVFMQKNGYRVDYFEQNTQTLNAFAFYTRGDLKTGERYSTQAKRNLYAGLSLLARHRVWPSLAAVYLDVCGDTESERNAYVQLKTDARSGLFKRVFVLRLEDLASTPAEVLDLSQFTSEIKGFEVSTLHDGKFFAVERFNNLPIVA
jgi:hypothetical protein